MGFHFETINSIGTAFVPQEDKTIMAQQMNETQRLQALEAYNPAEHLIKIKGRDGVLKDYYPAAWRFYELNLRYPNANFSTDLIFFDLEKNFCVVKVRLYLGPDYETSDKKAESMKQGLFTALDKIETAAKARCLRDFGIGTEYALEFSDDDELGMSSGASAPQQPASERDGQLATIKEQVKTLGLAHNPQQWTTWKKSVLGQDVADGKLTPAQVAKLNGAMEQAKSTKAA